MERRTLLAIGLMLIVAILPSLFFAPKPSPRPTGSGADSVTQVADTIARVPPVALPETSARKPPAVTPDTAPLPPAGPDSQPAQLVTVDSPLYRFVFSSRGGRLVQAVLKNYRSYAPGDSGIAQIIPDTSQFLRTRLVMGDDTVSLADWRFQPSTTALEVRDSATVLSWVAERGGATVRLEYEFRPDHYVFDVRGNFSEIATRGLLFIGLGPRIALVEADSVEDFRAYAVVTKANKTESLKFGSLDFGERRELSGPFEWVAVKSKYFAVAVMAVDQNQTRFGGAVAEGGLPSGKHAVRTFVDVSLAAPGGVFSYSVYAGPQEYHRLNRIGHEFNDINPYGWIFRPVIRPFAGAIVWVLIWMHENLNLAYGWVLILFGLAVRVVLWPLNQKAMRSSIAMQAVQPELKALQERYKNDAPKLQQEMMKLYKEHQVNPLGGCLPMLIPMPVLFALFFVFRETIEFRGVPFLWLPDLSRADPLFIIPVVMGLSMFGVSKIGQMGIPPNPQTKMITYVMPVVLTVLFLNFSSGLNLYYAVSNIASIPQQWLIAKEKQRHQSKKK